jgi:hypothetical protein
MPTARNVPLSPVPGRDRSPLADTLRGMRRRWWIFVIAALAVLAATIWIFRQVADTLERADQLAGTLGFFISLISLAAAIVGLYLQVKQNQTPQHAPAPTVHHTRTTRQPRRRTRRRVRRDRHSKRSLRWLLRLLVISGGTGALTFRCKAAYGISVVASLTAIGLAVGPAHAITLDTFGLGGGPAETQNAPRALPQISPAPTPRRSVPPMTGHIFSPTGGSNVQACTIFTGDVTAPTDWSVRLLIAYADTPTGFVADSAVPRRSSERTSWRIPIGVGGEDPPFGQRLLIRLAATQDTIPIPPQNRFYHLLDSVVVTRAGGANDCD